MRGRARRADIGKGVACCQARVPQPAPLSPNGRGERRGRPRLGAVVARGLGRGPYGAAVGAVGCRRSASASRPFSRGRADGGPEGRMRGRFVFARSGGEIKEGARWRPSSAPSGHLLPAGRRARRRWGIMGESGTEAEPPNENGPGEPGHRSCRRRNRAGRAGGPSRRAGRRPRVGAVSVLGALDVGAVGGQTTMRVPGPTWGGTEVRTPFDRTAGL